MRFMMFMIPKVYQPVEEGGDNAPAGFTPDADMVEKMMKFNEKLAQAGVLISLDGLHPLAAGARVAFGAGSPKVTDGPFVESKEVIGGFWLINARSKEEVVNWARQCPAQTGDVIEVRQVFEMTDFPEDVQKAADSAIVNDALAKS